MRPLAYSLAFYVTLVISAMSLHADNAERPFTAGERLIYSLKWGPFNVGEAVLEVINENTVFGEPSYHISFKVETNDFADKFYKVRTEIETFPTTNLERSMHYRSNQQEGKRHKNFTVAMDWENMEITRLENGTLRDPLIPEGPMHDPLSILFYFRTVELIEGAELPLPATDGKKLINVDAKVVEKSKHRVPAGKFETFRVQPNLKDLGGVFRKSKDATLDIWFSADERRIPVKLKSKVRVGSFTANLKRIEQVEDPHRYSEEEAREILNAIEKAFEEARVTEAVE